MASGREGECAVASRTIASTGGRLARLIIAAIALLGALCAGTVPAYAQVDAMSGLTLETVRARGYLICASTDPLPGFAQLNADGRWTGFDIDFCRAVAAAVLGDPDRMEFRPLRGEGRFALLQAGDVDLVARNAAWTMRRDSNYQASYVGISFYDGQAFMVPQELGVVSAYELDNVRVCVLDGGQELARLRDFFFTNQVSYEEVLYEDREDLTVAYRAGLCDAVSAAASWLHAIRRSLPEPAAHRILPERISKDAFGPVVRAGDAQWFKIVRWVLFALINAEEIGVSSLNIESLAAAKTHAIRRLLGMEGSFGPGLGLAPNFISTVIRSVGNYGEIFNRNFGPETGAPIVRGQNALWLNGGLLYAAPVE
jgi:general L-amino acid transport system substrate-binding protein